MNLMTKTQEQNIRTYNLLVSKSSLLDVSMDFVVGMPQTQLNKDFVMVMIDLFSR